MRPNKALVWLLLGCFLVGEANSTPFGRLRARLRSREQQRANPPAPAAGTPQASAQASSIGGGGITSGGGTPAGGGGGATDLDDLTDVDLTGALNGDVLGYVTDTWEPITLTIPVDIQDLGDDGAADDGDVPIWDEMGGVWSPGPPPGGGSGITVTGTEEGGRVPAYNPGNDDYRSTLDPHGLSVASFGASLRNEQAFADATTTTIALETGYDSHWPDDANPESNCVGWSGLILGAGPTHSVTAPTGIKVGTLGTTGSTKRSYTLVSRSGGLGHSAKATSVEVTDGVTANGESNYTFLAWRHNADARGYAIYSEIYTSAADDANKWHVADVPGCFTCWEVVCNATTAFTFADIGDTITQTGTGDTGTLVGYINDDGGAGRVWIVPVDGSDAGDVFDGTGVMTVNGRTGTPSGAGVNVKACYWEDHGERYYEGYATNTGTDWSNLWGNRAFRRMPTIGIARLANGHTALTSDTLLGILRIGQDEVQQLTQDSAAHWIRIHPLTPRDICDAPTAQEVYIPGKSVSGTLDGTVGMSIDPHQIGDTIIEPWSSSGRRYKCRRRNGWFMTGPDTTELQNFVVSGSPTGGTFTLTSSTYGTSNAISPGATAAQFTDAIRAVPGLEDVVGYIHATGAEAQTVTIINNGGSAGGAFTLTASGYGTTGASTWNATTSTMASNIQTALRTLTGFSSVTCAFTSGNYTAGAVFTVTFTGVAANISQMTSSDSMTGSVHSIAHATTIEGAINNTYRLAFIGVNGDTPQLTLNNSLTGGSTPTVTISTTTAGVGITMDSTLNNFTQEASGDLQWRREEADVPVNPPPASAMNDAQPFIVTAASGTTLTIDTDLSTPGNQGVDDGREPHAGRS
jgi:hypothetical protein